MTTRLPIAVADIIDSEAERLNKSRSDYLAEHLTVTHARLSEDAPEQAEDCSERGDRRLKVSGELEAPAHGVSERARRTLTARPESPLPAAAVDLDEVLRRIGRCVARSGLDGPELGAALGVSIVRFSEYESGAREIPAHLLLRAERISTGLEGAREAGWSTALDVSRRVTWCVRRGAARAAIDALAVGLRDLETCQLRDRDALAAWEGVPHLTGRREWDVLLAATVGHSFRTADLDPPDWAARRARPLKSPRMLGVDRRSQDEIRVATPGWLAALRVFIAAADLGWG